MNKTITKLINLCDRLSCKLVEEEGRAHRQQQIITGLNREIETLKKRECMSVPLCTVVQNGSWALKTLDRLRKVAPDETTANIQDEIEAVMKRIENLMPKGEGTSEGDQS